ncbi:unnamed protein product, partial [Soboliphyme baturini]|uniref:Palmitoyl-protein thioesterase 1 n=1 Tax=Soboliphyme baturini TaxID=241478 RepID=A0A183ITT0_9BILA
DTCCTPGFAKVTRILKDEIPNVYVKSVRIGNTTSDDFVHSYFGNVNEQIIQVCKELAEDSRFANGYSAIGFSQGSQFLRGLAEKCSVPQMKRLISFGGQHQGVYRKGTLIQAQFWHDPFDEETYRRESLFLADINNERGINESYRNNLKNLDKLVLVMFSNDTMVIPKESSWFGFYSSHQTTNVVPMEETDLYVQVRFDF